MAEQELSEDSQRRLEAGREAKQKSLEEFAARTKGKPTPTQDENDEAAHGKHIVEHEPDGGDPDPHGQAEPALQRQLGGESGGTYQTRQVQPTPTKTPSSSSTSPASSPSSSTPPKTS